MESIKDLTTSELASISVCPECLTDKHLRLYRNAYDNTWQVGCKACGSRGPAQGNRSYAIETWDDMVS